MAIRLLFTSSVAIALGVGGGYAAAQSALAAQRSAGGGDPVTFFNLLSKGKDYVDRAELSGLQLSIFDRIVRRLGVRTSRLTRADFMAVHENRPAESSQPRMASTISVPSDARRPEIRPPRSPIAGPWNGRGPMPPDGPDNTIQRPVVYRAGKLPKELPTWFASLDTNGDGQIGLYEWVRGGRSVEQFRTMDRNDDRFLTIDEVIRSLRQTALLPGTSRK